MDPKREVTMLRTTWRKIVSASGIGSLLFFGGCLSSGLAREVVITGAIHEAFEFLLDNGGIFDLFTDN